MDGAGGAGGAGARTADEGARGIRVPGDGPVDVLGAGEGQGAVQGRAHHHACGGHLATNGERRQCQVVQRFFLPVFALPARVAFVEVAGI